MTAMFGSKKEAEKSTAKQAGKSEVKKDSSKKTKKKAKKITEELLKKSELVNKTIISPIVSEDAMQKTTIGKYVFRVHPNVNKKQVAEAIEVLYGVDVVKVNIMKYKPENHRFRMVKGKKSGYKKAIVTVKAGQEIQLFSE